jgi:dTDP-4-amino-4,6-dideoxygalactose transaminase
MTGVFPVKGKEARDMKVPLVDLKKQYESIKNDVDAAMAEVIEKTAFIAGPFAKRFETAFAEYIGRKHCVGVGNGTDALVLAMRGLGLEPGDEVIVPAMTFIATTEAVTLAGGRVVFADVDPVERCLDPEAVASAITPRTRGIIPVHLYGQPADMLPLGALAEKHGLWVIEDSAQAHAAVKNNRKVGTFGDAACFSFYPGKNLGAYGDAGAVLCDSDSVADKIRSYANHGREEKYGHIFEGTNSRLDGLQAAVLSVKLPHLDDWTRARRAAAAIYTEMLQALPLWLPPDDPGHVYHLYALECDRRDDLLAHLKDSGVGASVHYPDALPLLKAYSYLGHRPGDFPVAERIASRGLSLPIFPEISGEQQEYVAGRVKGFFQ